jgi:hypothetical protein
MFAFCPTLAEASKAGEKSCIACTCVGGSSPLGDNGEGGSARLCDICEIFETEEVCWRCRAYVDGPASDERPAMVGDQLYETTSSRLSRHDVPSSDIVNRLTAPQKHRRLDST